MTTKLYAIPDPRQRPESFLTIYYKTLKAIEYDDRAWDKLFFARCCKRAQELLEILEGDVRTAVRCMRDLKERFEADGTKWTIETIISYSFEWRAEQMKRTDREATQRFIADLAQQTKTEGPELIGSNVLLRLVGKICGFKEEELIYPTPLLPNREAAHSQKIESPLRPAHKPLTEKESIEAAKFFEAAKKKLKEDQWKTRHSVQPTMSTSTESDSKNSGMSS